MRNYSFKLAGLSRVVCLAAIFLAVEFIGSAATPPAIEWQRSFGGSGEENCRRILSTRDGGFLLGGDSASGVSGNKTSPNYGGWDFWLVKIDAHGNKLWDESFGGSGNDAIRGGLAVTDDGGFLLGGLSLSGASGNKTSPNYGGWDFWLVKIDANGNKLWDKSFGGSRDDIINAIVPMADGGFLLGGVSASGVSGNKTSVNYGGHDVWLVKIDALGNKLWDRSFGGSSREGDDTFAPLSIVPSGDGGFLVGLPSMSGVSGNKTSVRYGDFDYWLFKVDADGNKVWEQSFGGSDGDFLNAIAPVADGGFLLGGYSRSNVSGNKTTPNYGLRDGWLINVDASGKKLWEKTLGGDGEENVTSIASADDGGFLLGGWTVCYPLCGNFDFWLAKVDANGDQLWQQTYGGSGVDDLSAVVSSDDGGFLLGGRSSSGISGDKTTASFGTYDFWLVKLAALPKLAIKQSAGSVRIAWPRSAAAFVLDQTSALESSSTETSWSQVSIPYETNATEIFITESAPIGNMFYRLRGP